MEAERWVRKTDHERTDFVTAHFQKNPADPLGYDLILNSARYSVDGAAELIIEALHCLQATQTSPSSLPLSRRGEEIAQSETGSPSGLQKA